MPLLGISVEANVYLLLMADLRYRNFLRTLLQVLFVKHECP